MLLCIDVCIAAGSNFSYEEVAEVPNVFVAGIALVMLTLSCALFICKPLYPIINRLLPYVGSGVSPYLHSYLYLMLYYSKAEQVSLARQDLCHKHLAFAGTWNHYYKNYHNAKQNFHVCLHDGGLRWICVMSSICPDINIYIDAVVKTVERIQSMECIQQHVITTALVLAQLWSSVAQMQN